MPFEVMQQDQDLSGLFGAKQQAEIGDGGQQTAPDGGPGTWRLRAWRLRAWRWERRWRRGRAAFLKNVLEKGANEPPTGFTPAAAVYER